MDLQALADSFESMTCIMSVEVFPDGSYGNIRIVAGNKPYVNSIENSNSLCFSDMLDNKFVPNSPYEPVHEHLGPKEREALKAAEAEAEDTTEAVAEETTEAVAEETTEADAE